MSPEWRLSTMDLQHFVSCFDCTLLFIHLLVSIFQLYHCPLLVRLPYFPLEIDVYKIVMSFNVKIFYLPRPSGIAAASQELCLFVFVVMRYDTMFCILIFPALPSVWQVRCNTVLLNVSHCWLSACSSDCTDQLSERKMLVLPWHSSGNIDSHIILCLQDSRFQRPCH